MKLICLFLYAMLKFSRRLLYVACTRAQGLLYLTHAAKRKVNGEQKTKEVSPFLAAVTKKNKVSLLRTHPVDATDTMLRPSSRSRRRSSTRKTGGCWRRCLIGDRPMKPRSSVGWRSCEWRHDGRCYVRTDGLV